jgi:hypothetical protein
MYVVCDREKIGRREEKREKKKRERNEQTAQRRDN